MEEKTYRVIEAFELNGETQEVGAEIALNEEDAETYATHLEEVVVEDDEDGDDDDDDDDDDEEEEEDDTDEAL